VAGPVDTSDGLKSPKSKMPDGNQRMVRRAFCPAPSGVRGHSTVSLELSGCLSGISPISCGENPVSSDSARGAAGPSDQDAEVRSCPIGDLHLAIDAWRELPENDQQNRKRYAESRRNVDDEPGLSGLVQMTRHDAASPSLCRTFRRSLRL
jgi:hypothetical protein